MSGSPIRQDYLETVIDWHRTSTETIEEYMGKNQHKPDATPLWLYFQSVINWVKALHVFCWGKKRSLLNFLMNWKPICCARI